jgi:hypothetical protein
METETCEAISKCLHLIQVDDTNEIDDMCKAKSCYMVDLQAMTYRYLDPSKEFNDGHGKRGYGQNI